MRQPRLAVSPSADRCRANKRGTIRSCSSRSSASSSSTFPPLSSHSVLLPLLLPPPPPPPVTSVSVGQGQRVLTPHTSGIKANKRRAPRRRRELGPRPRKKTAMSARESGGGFVSTAPLTSTATFFPLSNQTASTQMQLQGIHLFRMTDPVLSALFGGIKSILKSRFSNNKHSKNVIHTSASPCWGWTLMGTRFLPSFHPQSRGGSRVSTAFPICELYIHTHIHSHTHTPSHASICWTQSRQAPAAEHSSCQRLGAWDRVEPKNRTLMPFKYKVPLTSVPVHVCLSNVHVHTHTRYMTPEADAQVNTPTLKFSIRAR